MAPAGTITAPPRVNLLIHAGIVSADEDMLLGQTHESGPDTISDEIGRPGFIEGYVLDECLVPAEDPNHDHEPAVFDRYYFPDEDTEAGVLVDVLPGGSDHEVSAQEAEKHVALKRRWCKAHGRTYQVVVAMPSPVPLG